MAVSLSGYWLLDSIDLWDGFKTGILKGGSTDLLQYAPKKDSIEHDWLDEHGIEVDLSAPKFDPRTLNITCIIITNTKNEFFDNYNALINQLMLPGLHALQIVAHGTDKNYYVYYKSCSAWSQVKSIKLDNNIMIVHQFTLTLSEPQPEVGASTSRIIDEDGRYLVT